MDLVQLVECLPTKHKALGDKEVHTCNPISWKVESEGSGVQGQPHLHSLRSAWAT